MATPGVIPAKAGIQLKKNHHTFFFTFWWRRHPACVHIKGRRDACPTQKRGLLFIFLLDSRFRGIDANGWAMTSQHEGGQTAIFLYPLRITTSFSCVMSRTAGPMPPTPRPDGPLPPKGIQSTRKVVL